MVRFLSHLEGLVFFLVALYLYAENLGNWWIFVALLFLPDIAMVGYFKDKRMGAIIYNIMHNYVLAVVLIAIGSWIQNNIVLLAGIVLLAHVGLDRALGYGMKYATNFKDTHLQRV